MVRRTEMALVMRTTVCMVAGFAMLLAGSVYAATNQEQPREKLQVLLISGQNNHDWKRTTPLMKDILEDSGRFEVTVSMTPPKGAQKGAWSRWRPKFKQYDAVLSDYNGRMWPAPVRKDFEAYVAGGGGVVIQHAANNPFKGWDEFEKMVGLLWRSPEEGYRVYIDDKDKVVRVPPGKGPGAGHGVLHNWQIKVRQPEHPVFKNMPEVWLHAHDELYHAQRGPAENMHILATAYSDPKTKGTGKHEPQVWWIPYGQGKVLSFMPGHLWEGQKQLIAFRSVGLRVLLQRCTEWVATGEVTIPVPDNFPTAKKISLVDKNQVQLSEK
jgi:Txe/YoeB family toxin of Txe-Axe toxin-antitoxin module